MPSRIRIKALTLLFGGVDRHPIRDGQQRFAAAFSEGRGGEHFQRPHRVKWVSGHAAGGIGKKQLTRTIL